MTGPARSTIPSPSGGHDPMGLHHLDDNGHCCRLHSVSRASGGNVAVFPASSNDEPSHRRASSPRFILQAATTNNMNLGGHLQTANGSSHQLMEYSTLTFLSDPDIPVESIEFHSSIMNCEKRGRIQQYEVVLTSESRNGTFDETMPDPESFQEAIPGNGMSGNPRDF